MISLSHRYVLNRGTKKQCCRNQIMIVGNKYIYHVVYNSYQSCVVSTKFFLHHYQSTRLTIQYSTI